MRVMVLHVLVDNAVGIDGMEEIREAIKLIPGVVRVEFHASRVIEVE